MGPLIMFFILAGIWKSYVWAVKSLDRGSSVLYKKFRTWLWFKKGIPSWLNAGGLMKMYRSKGTIKQPPLVKQEEPVQFEEIPTRPTYEWIMKHPGRHF